MSADELRRAATVLRERMEPLEVRAVGTGGPWYVVDGFMDAEIEAHDPDMPTIPSMVGTATSAPLAVYIATMHPGVGLALADALEDAGSKWNDGAAAHFGEWNLRGYPLLVVARAILGEPS